MPSDLRSRLEHHYDSALATCAMIAETQNIPKDADWTLGQAMAAVLFDINQSLSPTGVAGTILGRVGRLKERLMVEVVPFSKLPARDAKRAFIEYTLRSRFDAPDADPKAIRTGLVLGLLNCEKEALAALIQNANRHQFDWIEYIRADIGKIIEKKAQETTG